MGKGNTNAKLHKVLGSNVLGTFKERDIVKTINNLSILSFSSIFDSIKILMRPLTAVKRD